MKKPPLEKTIVNQVVAYINSNGGFAVKIWGNPTQEKGIPDVLGCYRGRFLGLETKRPAGKEPTPYQRYQLERITQTGGVAQVIRSVQEVIDLMDMIDQEDA